jgi:hypothetical protein
VLKGFGCFVLLRGEMIMLLLHHHLGGFAPGKMICINGAIVAVVLVWRTALYASHCCRMERFMDADALVRVDVHHFDDEAVDGRTAYIVGAEHFSNIRKATLFVADDTIGVLLEPRPPTILENLVIYGPLCGFFPETSAEAEGQVYHGTCPCVGFARVIRD